jgi:multiple sugar transport system ATP-binding protein
VLFGVRPEHLTNVFTAEKRDGAGLVPLDIPVEIVEPLGADTLVFSRLGKTEIVSRVATTADLRPGEQIRVHVDTDSVHLFDPETGNRLATSPRRLNAP